MKKQLIIAIAAGVVLLAYLTKKKKYEKLIKQPEPEAVTPVTVHNKHHLTKAFSNAKKHALHTANNV